MIRLRKLLPLCITLIVVFGLTLVPAHGKLVARPSPVSGIRAGAHRRKRQYPRRRGRERELMHMRARPDRPGSAQNTIQFVEG